MPYISQGNRHALDTIIDGLVKRLRDIECRPGDCNYVVTRVVLEALRPESGWSYHDLHDAVGLLRDAAGEIERRLMGPYEDVAIRRNGDMQCFAEPFAYCPEYLPIANAHDLRGERRSLVNKIQKGMAEQHEERDPAESPYRKKLEADMLYRALDEDLHPTPQDEIDEPVNQDEIDDALNGRR